MILKLRIDIQDLKSFVPETYLAAELDALEDIVPVDVIVPLDAVHMRSRADHLQSSRKRSASSRATSDTPQKHDCCPSPEQENSMTAGVLEALLS
jgi:hypothetical protein